jgi:hypothetical protein
MQMPAKRATSRQASQEEIVSDDSQAGEMTNLTFCLNQGGSQERHPVDMVQAHHGLMRKQQG